MQKETPRLCGAAQHLYPFYFEIWGIQFEADKHEDQSLHEDRSTQANKEMDLQIFK